MEKTIHQGRNVKRFREMLGIKQEALADELGEDWNQKKVSLLEAREVIDGETLEEVAKVLKVPSEAIKNFDEEAAVFNIQNNYEGSNPNATNVGPAQNMNYQCSFNPIDKLVEVYEENRRLYEELLREKDEKIILLEKILGGG
jgi:transcriptional regulator with XRE-family HTH domain